MASRSLASFQALLYLITFHLASGGTETAAALIGIACHIGRRCGLHEDALVNQMSPFIADMRRRAWLYLHYLDLQCCEADGHGSSLTKHEYVWPVNVDETSWEDWLHTQRSPTPRSVETFTGMTLVLMRAKGEELKHSLLNSLATLSTDEAHNRLAHFLEEIDQGFPSQADEGATTHLSPMQQLTTTYIRLQFEQVRLAVDIGQVKYGRKVGDAIKNDIFLRATHILCGITHLERSSDEYGWSWYFQRSPPFHAAAAVLCHLMHRPQHFSDTAKLDAWRETERFFSRHALVLEDGFGEESKAWDVLRTWRQHAMVNFGDIFAGCTIGSRSPDWCCYHIWPGVLARRYYGGRRRVAGYNTLVNIMITSQGMSLHLKAIIRILTQYERPENNSMESSLGQ